MGERTAVEPTADDLASADVVLVRHALSTYNVRGLLNGDPRVPVPLADGGRRQAEAARALLSSVPWAATFVTRFARTRETLALIAPGAPAPRVLIDLDDVAGGAFEGRPLVDYRRWRHTHGLHEAPAGGESRAAVCRRYARGLAFLAREAPRPALVVAHDQALRYLQNGLAGDHPVLGPALGIPNAVPFAYTAADLERGAAILATAAVGAERGGRHPASLYPFQRWP